MKITLIFVSALLAAFVSAWNEDLEPTPRFLTVVSSEGVVDVVDTEAPTLSTFASTSDIKLYLYTKSQRSAPSVLPLDAQTVSLSPAFDSKKNNIFIIHGWSNDYKSQMNRQIKNAYLDVVDVNLFVVDWSSKAKSTYGLSFAAVPKIGKLLGYFISELQDNLKLDSSKFTIVGHSLGAHVAGCAGEAANSKVSVIVGLDPAGPLYSTKNINNRLDPTDAEFVHVVHTNAGNLGFKAALGNVDFRPNGGRKQPGCSLDAFGSCAHSRAYQLFAKSIVSGGFTAYACDSYDNFEKGRCSSNAQARLGGAVIDTSAKGDFYLKISS